jgi:hypothetical protein
MRVDRNLSVLPVPCCNRFDIPTPASDLYVRPTFRLQLLPNLLAIDRLITDNKDLAFAQLQCCQGQAGPSNEQCAADGPKPLHDFASSLSLSELRLALDLSSSRRTALPVIAGKMLIAVKIHDARRGPRVNETDVF